jgi:1-acyl-sn-glycerol-3-phosphate acyltransferase
VITSLYAYTFLRARPISADKVPGRGAVILAPNHFSFMDHFLIGCYIRRKVRFMAKSQLFKRPMQFIYTHGGVFPVRRGARDEETFITAERILQRGGAVAMYCEGGRSRTGKVSEQAKRGIGRLALESGATVVPIAVHGSSHIRNWKRLRFPRVTVQYGDPIRWEPIENPTREQQQAVADEILVEIRRLYAGLQQHGRRGILKRVRAERGAEPGAPKGAAA